MTDDKFTEIRFNYKHSDLMVKFNSIHIDPKNPRIGTNPKDDQSLQESVLENGLNMQIVITETDKKGEYIIVFGHRRYDIFVEAGYKNTNPLIPCTVIVPFDDPDRPLTDDEIFDYRDADEDHHSKLSFHERIVNIFQKTEEKLDAGWSLTKIAKEVHHETLSWLSHNLNAFKSPVIRKAIEDGEVTSMHQAWNLLGIDAEAQETLIDAKKDIKATGMEKAAKLVREGTETASAIESVKHPEDERTLIIRTAPEDTQERLLDATKDMDLHDTERVVKQVIMGVTVPEAVRAVELHTKAPQGTEEDALTVNDGEGETTETEKDDDSGRKSLQPPSPETTGIIADAFAKGGGEKGTEGEEEEPERETCPTCNGNAYLKQGSAQVLCPNCHGKGFTLKEKGIEEAEPLAVAQSSLPEGGTDSHTPDVDPPTESKKKEPQVCAKVSNMEEMLQKLVNKPPKTFLATFKTTSHKGNFKNRVEGIHLWSGELVDLMESDLNGDSPFLCEIKRKRNAVMEILDRPKHSIIENERDKLDDLMDELKTKIEQDAKRGG